MQSTENYALNLFDGSDPVLAESFNANTQILDTELAKKINGVSYTYTGNGVRTKTFTFDSKPVLIFLSSLSGYVTRVGIAINGNRHLRVNSSDSSAVVTPECSWSGNSMTISALNADDGSEFVFNKNGTTYRITALLE